MLDLSPDKLLMLAVVALVVLGPNRLPGAARSLGRMVGQLRAMSSSLQTEVREALHDPEDALTSAVADFRPAQLRRNVRKAVTDTLSPLPPASAPIPSTVSVDSNLPPRSSSTGLPAAAAGPAAGWDGRPVPDDPGFN